MKSVFRSAEREDRRRIVFAESGETRGKPFAGVLRFDG